MHAVKAKGALGAASSYSTNVGINEQRWYPYPGSGSRTRYARPCVGLAYRSLAALTL
jgi:hypothetical protein